MKQKSFTLIEILIATMIFMTVVIVGVATFAAVKRSNELSGDSAKTEECSRQVGNFTDAVFRSASYFRPRVMAVVYESGRLKFKELLETGGQVQARGFAVFSPSDQANKTVVSVIFKNLSDDSKKSGYFYKSGTLDTQLIKNNFNLNSFLSFSGSEKPQRIHSNECLPLKTARDGFANYQNPFLIKLSYPYEAGPSSLIGKPVFSLTVNDLIFSAFSAQGLDDKSLSRIFINVTNNIKPL